MADRALTVDLFCEDSGHESFTRALLRRLAADLGLPVPHVRARSARGGHGRAIAELKAWQRGRPDEPGDLLVVVIDGNSVGWKAQRRAVEAAIDIGKMPRWVVGCPDPHVEAWAAADLSALRVVLEANVAAPAAGTTNFKAWLHGALIEADAPILSDAMDVAPEIVAAMDFFAAGKNSPSLKAFVDGLKAALRSCP